MRRHWKIHEMNFIFVQKKINILMLYLIYSIMQIMIGNIRPKSSVLIKISYL